MPGYLYWHAIFCNHTAPAAYATFILPMTTTIYVTTTCYHLHHRAHTTLFLPNAFYILPDISFLPFIAPAVAVRFHGDFLLYSACNTMVTHAHTIPLPFAAVPHCQCRTRRFAVGILRGTDAHTPVRTTARVHTLHCLSPCYSYVRIYTARRVRLLRFKHAVTTRTRFPLLPGYIICS